VELFLASEHHKIPLAHCHSQGYDNGLNMGGKIKGVKICTLKRTVLLFTLHVVLVPLILWV